MLSHKYSQHFLAALAALLMSSLAVGATVAPDQVAASSVKVVSYV